MGMMDAVKLFFRRYTEFRGRSSRAEYWWVQLFNLLVMIVPYLILLTVGIGSGGFNLIGILMALIIGAYVLAVLIPGLAISFRRMHDRNMTAWWLLLGLIPYVGSLVLIVIFVLPGTKGPNTYGTDPLDPSGGTADVFA